RIADAGGAGSRARYLKPRPGRFLDGGGAARVVHPAFAQRVEPVDLAEPGKLDQGHHLLVAGLEAHRGARGHVEPHSPGETTLEAQRTVDLEEVEVGADLDGPIRGVGHGELDGAPARVGLDVPLAEDVLAWDHSLSPRSPSPALSPDGGRGRVISGSDDGW